jgi:signal transduction histidine kinase
MDTRVLLEGILDASPDAITVYESVVDAQGTIVDMRLVMLNTLSAAILQVDPAVSLGKLFSELAPEAFESDRYKWLTEVAATGIPLEREIFADRPDGKSLWVNVSVRRFEQYAVITYTDITQRKAAEAEKERQHLLLSQIFATPLLGIMIFDEVRDEKGGISDFLLVKVNEAGFSMPGFPASIQGKRHKEYFPETESVGLFKQFVAVCETGIPLETEHFYPQLDQWYALMGSKLENGLLLTFQNITARKKAEQAREEQTNLLISITKSINIGISTHDVVRDKSGNIVDFRYTYFNEQARHWLPLDWTQVINRTVRELDFSSKADYLVEQMAQVVQTGEPFRVTTTLADGRVIDTIVTQLLEGTVATFIDITQQQQAEDKIRQQALALELANRDLKRSNENLESFAYVASHDLKEPLRKIQQFSGILLDRHTHQLNEQGGDLLHRMQLASERMSKLIRDLLAYSRLSTQFLPPETVSLETVLLETTDDLELLIQETGATITVDPLPVIQGNSTQLKQLFVNLINNAIKFRQPAGMPRIEIQYQTIKKDDMASPLPNSSYRVFHKIDVTDNGIGFEQRYADQIFGVFQRLHSKQAYPGTGIGLAICAQVAALHGGTLSASSTPGTGSTFSLYLPAIEIHADSQ